MPEGTPAADGGQPNTLEGLAANRQNPGTPAPAADAPNTPPAEAPAPQGEQVPPWERDGQQFDPERAWTRIQNMQRDLETARSRVTEFEQAAMTDQQRIEARAAAAEEAATNAQRELARYRVAADKGVPADLLAGTTEEEMAAHADRLIAFGGQRPPAVPSFDGGARTPTEGADMNDLLRRRLRG